MKEIKTKSVIKDIKALDKMADVSRKVKNTYIRTKEQMEQFTTHNKNSNFVDTAGNEVGESAEAIVRNTGDAVVGYVKRAEPKILRHRQGDTTTSHTDTFNNSWTKHGNKQSNHTERQAASNVKEQPQKSIFPMNAEQAVNRRPVPARKLENLKQKAVSSKANEAARHKFILSRKNKSAKHIFIQNEVKQQLDQSKVTWMSSKSTVSTQSQRLSRPICDQSTQQAFFQSTEGAKVQALYTARPTGHTIKQSATVRGKAFKHTANMTIKLAKKSTKTIQYGIKTSQAIVKTAAKTTRTSEMAAQTVRMAVRAAAVSVKAFISTAKAMLATAKSLTAVVATGGCIVLVVILVICIAGFFTSTSFGVFLSNENSGDDTPLMKEVVNSLNTEFSTKIQQIQQGNPHDTLELSGSEGISVSRWCEILAIYAVKVAADPEQGMEVAALDDTKVGILRNTFWDMNKIDYWLETIENKELKTTTDGDGNENTVNVITTKVVLHIRVTFKSYIEMTEHYDFNEEQEEMLNELMKEEYRQLFTNLIHN